MQFLPRSRLVLFVPLPMQAVLYSSMGRTMTYQNWKHWEWYGRAVKHFRHYLYGNHCEVFTDHIALKSLLSTPQPSGKLARWGMALQDIDLKIQYRAGKKNSNADALSHCPIHKEESPTISSCQPFAIVAATSPPKVPTKGGETPLSELQQQDRNLCEIIDYQKTGTLPL